VYALAGNILQIWRTEMKIRFRVVTFSVLVVFYAAAFHVTSFAQSSAVNVNGKWQISWEARLGTERDMILLDQTDSKLTGSFQGKLGSPKVSGNLAGKNISLRLDFAGKQSYSLVFTGVVDGDKMSGRFEIPGMDKPYDFHGENVASSNYTWQAVRMPDIPHANADSADKPQR
jgi:hypothetical protein